MFSQKINVYIAMMMVFSFGLGASYIIIKFANTTDFAYLATNIEI